jgi:hypothetical protein
MPTYKTLAVLAASSALAIVAITPVYAESIPQEEQQQLDNSARSVDPGASRGPDAPIVTQEREQLNNSAQPDVPMGAGAATGGDPSIVDQEQKDLQ